MFDFLETLNSMAGVLERRIAPFPGFVEDVREQAFSRFARTVAAWPWLSMYSGTCSGAMASSEYKGDRSSAQRSASYRIETLLPERVAERIDHDENIRQGKRMEALLEKKPKAVDRPAEAPRGVMQRPLNKKPDSQAEVPVKTVVPGVDHDPSRNI